MTRPWAFTWLDERAQHPCYAGDDAPFRHSPNDNGVCSDCGAECDPPETEEDQMTDDGTRLKPPPAHFAAYGDEPPVGSIVAPDGCPPYLRGNDGAWLTAADDHLIWHQAWTSDLRILRWGWTA